MHISRGCNDFHYMLLILLSFLSGQLAVDVPTDIIATDPVIPVGPVLHCRLWQLTKSACRLKIMIPVSAIGTAEATAHQYFID
jgi:hypothetical protein